MNSHRSLAVDDDRARRAVLRDRILASARLLGWPARTTIVFTEQLARRPWKRCRAAELVLVLEQLHAILGVDAVHASLPRNICTARGDRPSDGRVADAERA